jgi:hypothetical protein
MQSSEMSDSRSAKSGGMPGAVTLFAAAMRAADEGGRIVVTGTTEEVAAYEASATGRILAREFTRDAALVRE